MTVAKKKKKFQMTDVDCVNIVKMDFSQMCFQVRQEREKVKSVVWLMVIGDPVHGWSKHAKDTT